MSADFKTTELGKELLEGALTAERIDFFLLANQL